MKPAGHIFISYRHDEVDFALTLACDLRSAGVSIWMDRLDGISVGMAWRDALRQGINDCKAMVCILSPGYVEADYCRKELGRADTLKRPIYPVLLRPIEAGKMPLELEGIQYEDFSTWPNDAGYTRGLARLLKRLETQTRDLVSAAPDAERSYLTKLLATLESRRGVLQYVPLEGDATAQELRPEPVDEDEWGFSELVVAPNQGSAQPSVPIQSIGDAMTRYERFVLIGAPGAGKTTTLRKLVRDAAVARLNHPDRAPLPLPIQMAEWKESATALEFVRSRHPFLNRPSSRLQDTILYLDGLNEMGADVLKKIELLDNWLQSPEAPQKVILTCRAADYAVLGKKLSPLPTVSIKALDDSRIQNFAQVYLRSQAESFLSQVRRSSTPETRITPDTFREERFYDLRGLGKLASNPYMLSALIFMYEKSPERELPHRTAELFQRLVRALWKREEQRGSTSNLHFGEAEACYARLAYRIIADNASLDFTMKTAVDAVGSPQMLYAGQATGYLTGGSEHLSFTHQLLLEYFAAVALKDVDLSTIVEPFELQKGPNYLWLKYNYESRWYQPILFACELSKDLDQRLQQIHLRNPFLAAECVAEADAISGDLVRSIARGVFDEAQRLLMRLKDRQAWVAANRGDSGIWDDIEDSIEESLGELYKYSATTMARLGEQVIPVLRDNLGRDKGLAVESLKLIGTVEAMSTARLA